MITARDIHGKVVYASRNVGGVAPEAFCPCCHKRMRARVGEQRRPHWAHESGERCDEWWEEESDWRNAWISVFIGSDKVDVENVIEKDGTRHFYDIRFGGRQVAIFRRRKLTRDQVLSRERFFEDMFWFVEGKSSEYERLRKHLDNRTIRPIPGAKHCFECRRCCAEPSPFYNRWMECGMPVVYDFGPVEPDKELSLWCVLPDGGASRILLEFPRADFIRRLRELGSLLRKSVEEVKQGIVTIAKARSAKPHTRVESLGKTVHPTLSLRKRCRLTPYSPPPPPPSRKTFEELVEEFERLGFSHGDAESKARLQLSRE